MGQLIDLHLQRTRRRPGATPPAPAAAAPVTCVFDPLSPFTHLALERVERALPRARWQPVDAGPGVLGPDLRDAAEARAAELGVRLSWPHAELTSDLAAPRRVALAASLEGRGARFAIALGRLAFSGGFDPTELATLLEAGTAVGMDTGVICGAALDPTLDVALAGAREMAGAPRAADLPLLRVAGRSFTGEAELPAAIAFARASGAAIASA